MTSLSTPGGKRGKVRERLFAPKPPSFDGLQPRLSLSLSLPPSLPLSLSLSLSRCPSPPFSPISLTHRSKKKKRELTASSGNCSIPIWAKARVSKKERAPGKREKSFLFSPRVSFFFSGFFLIFYLQKKEKTPFSFSLSLSSARVSCCTSAQTKQCDSSASKETAHRGEWKRKGQCENSFRARFLFFEKKTNEEEGKKRREKKEKPPEPSPNPTASSLSFSHPLIRWSSLDD